MRSHGPEFRELRHKTLLALAWLANFLAPLGKNIPAGSVILTGGLTRAHPARAGQSFVAEFAELGTVRAHFS